MKRKNADENEHPAGSLILPKKSLEKSASRESANGILTRHPSHKRRSSFASICFYYMKYVVLVVLIPPFLNYAALSGENNKLIPVEGVLYDIGFGQKLFMKCVGKGLPTVILDAPTGMSSDVWTSIQEQVAKRTKVCIYDRAGLGFSERPLESLDNSSADHNNKQTWKVHTLERMVDDLNRLITKSSQQAKPFVLVGSELGALVARFYAQLYEGEVTSLILVDPLVEDIFSYDNGVWNQFWFGNLIPSFQSLQLTAAMGISRLAVLCGMLEPALNGKQVPEDVKKRQKHLLCHPRHMSSVVDEHYFMNESFSQMRTLRKVKPFPSDIKVTVVTGNYYDDQLPSALNKAWAKSQEYLISKLYPGSHHIMINGADRKKIYNSPKSVSDVILKSIKKWRAKTQTS